MITTNRQTSSRQYAEVFSLVLNHAEVKGTAPEVNR